MTQINIPETYSGDVAQLTENLRTRFDERWRVSEPNLPIVKELQARIGEIDPRSEGYESIENQRDLSIKFTWGHNHQISDEIYLEGRMRDRHLGLLAEFCTGFGLSESFFSDRAVLDVGIWTGGTSLALAMLGARRIQGIEEVRKYADAAKCLINDALGQDHIKITGVSIYDIDDQIGKHDLIYYPGVIYHVSDPVLSLRLLFNQLEDGGEILVESYGIDSKASVCEYRGNRLQAQFGEAGQLNRGGWNWFVPSALCLERWMIEAGFNDVRTYYSPARSRVFGYAKRTTWQPITRAGFARSDVP